MGVDADLCKNIVDCCESLLCYKKPLLLTRGDTCVDTSSCPKKGADTHIKFPSATYYCLDEKFNGPEAFDSVAKELATSCKDCSLFVQKHAVAQKRNDYLFYELRCSCYKVQTKDMTKFNVGQFAQARTRPVTNKKQRSINQTTVIDRMANSKMKGNNVINSKKAGHKYRYGDDIILNNRTQSSRATSTKIRCQMRISLLLNPADGRWFLHDNTNLEHKFHYEIPPKASVLDPTDLTKDEEAWIEEMYKMGLSNGTISGVMTGYFNQNGKEGAFKVEGIKHLTQKHTKEMNLLSGIESDMSQAEKTIRELNRRNISHVCLTMAPNGDLVVYKNKGRPTSEERIIMDCPEKMRVELQKLRDELTIDHGNEILVALSIASDQMLRHVHMFPETWFMDVTANTNKLKRDIFLMVVRDANGQCFVGNLTVIPSGQSWVFMKIYRTFFVKLYGDVTISRNRLGLTDKRQI